jgi:hypothetical protein
MPSPLVLCQENSARPGEENIERFYTVGVSTSLPLPWKTQHSRLNPKKFFKSRQRITDE